MRITRVKCFHVVPDSKEPEPSGKVRVRATKMIAIID